MSATKSEKRKTIAHCRCPVCGGELVARGFAWACPDNHCRFSCGRAYRRDPQGYDLPDKYAVWGQRMSYRMKIGLSFEKGKERLPDTLYYRFVPAYPHEEKIRLEACQKESETRPGVKITSRKTLFASNPFDTNEQAMEEFKVFLKVQEQNPALEEDKEWK